MKHTNRTALFLSILIFSGCTFRGLAYRNLDWIAVRQINKHFNLNREQRQVYEGRIREIIEENKASMVRAAIDVLNVLKEATADLNFSEEEFQAVEQQFFTNFRQLIEPLTPEISGFLKSLGPQQIEHFRKKQEEGNKWLRNLAEAEDKNFDYELQKSLEKSNERYSRWIGELSEQQRDMLRKVWPQSKEQAQKWLAARREQQEAFIKVWTESNEEELSQFFQQWLADPEALRKRAEIHDDRTRFLEFLRLLRPTLDMKQLQFLNEKADELQKDLSSLISG